MKINYCVVDGCGKQTEGRSKRCKFHKKTRLADLRVKYYYLHQRTSKREISEFALNFMESMGINLR